MEKKDMKNMSLESFCDLVSRHGATAGGGSAAFLSLALGCALVEKSFQKRPVPPETMAWLGKSRLEFLSLIQKDADMFNEYLNTNSDDALFRSCGTLMRGIEIVMSGYNNTSPDNNASIGLLSLIRLRGQVKASISSDYAYGINLISNAAGSLRDTLALNIRYLKDKGLADKLSGFVSSADEYLKVVGAQWG